MWEGVTGGGVTGKEGATWNHLSWTLVQASIVDGHSNLYPEDDWEWARGKSRNSGVWSRDLNHRHGCDRSGDRCWKLSLSASSDIDHHISPSPSLSLLPSIPGYHAAGDLASSCESRNTVRSWLISLITWFIIVGAGLHVRTTALAIARRRRRPLSWCTCSCVLFATVVMPYTLKLLVALMLYTSLGIYVCGGLPVPTELAPPPFSPADAQPPPFRFANYYGDHMVLQRAPEQANVWGYVDGCKAVVVTFNGANTTATITPGIMHSRDRPISVVVCH